VTMQCDWWSGRPAAVGNFEADEHDDEQNRDEDGDENGEFRAVVDDCNVVVGTCERTPTKSSPVMLTRPQGSRPRPRPRLNITGHRATDSQCVTNRRTPALLAIADAGRSSASSVSLSVSELSVVN